jgi:hypothetical protein
MDSQTFDPDTFMQQTVDEPMATEFRICPQGEYQAMIDDFDSKAFTHVEWQDKQTGEQKSAPQFSCPFVIQDEKVKAELGREKLVVPAKMFLDINAAGGLDFGPDRNVRLGQIREATGQNVKGPWSIMNLRGAGPVMVKVTHRQDKRNPERKFAEVTRVVAIR